MKTYLLFIVLLMAFFSACDTQETPVSEYGGITQVDSGKAVSVMLTAYSTTLLANGKDKTRLRIAVTDSAGHEITSASDSIRIFVTSGEPSGEKIKAADGHDLPQAVDTSGTSYYSSRLKNGICNLVFITGIKPGKIKVEARSGKLWPGAHEIHTVPADFKMLEPTASQLPETTKPIGRMIGADISFLPQIEDRGTKFTDMGKEKDAVRLLSDHGFNYIRLRIFVNPENEKGYAPQKGYCGPDYTIEMAKRIKKAGMNFLLDFHYSDYWADPQQQNKPLSWADLDFETLKDSLKTYTSNVLITLRKQDCFPDMVQIGNEINHGFLWPDGHISNPDKLAELLKAAVNGVEEVDPALPVMMHIALGGQNEEAVFWLNNMIARGVKFDIIGLSYYPRWHGTLDDLNGNLHDLLKRYKKPLNIVEYNNYKQEVHDIVFALPGDMGKGACIWEPLSRRSNLFNRNNETTELISVYNRLNKMYLAGQH